MIRELCRERFHGSGSALLSRVRCDDLDDPTAVFIGPVRRIFSVSQARVKVDHSQNSSFVATVIVPGQPSMPGNSAQTYELATATLAVGRD